VLDFARLALEDYSCYRLGSCDYARTFFLLICIGTRSARDLVFRMGMMGGLCLAICFAIVYREISGSLDAEGTSLSRTTDGVFARDRYLSRDEGLIFLRDPVR
jgi:hypothetical protein